jgi:hypothetical protein
MCVGIEGAIVGYFGSMELLEVTQSCRKIAKYTADMRTCKSSDDLFQFI